MQFTSGAVFSYLQCCCMIESGVEVCACVLLLFFEYWLCLQEKWEGLSKFLDVILGSCKEVGKNC